MRKRALFSLVGALIAAVALVSASGAATAKAQKVTRIDVSTRVAVVHYLRSIHVNPKGAVIQRGGRNYAGANCPGRGWTCTSTKHTVVQIAKRGGTNRFACRSKRCVVVQLSGVSHGIYIRGRQLASTAATGGGSTATCVKATGLTQSCTINQSGTGPNTAGVYENAGKQSGLTQSAVYSALITQQASGSNGNTACVTQIVNIDGSTIAKKGTPVTVTLDAHQSVVIRQDVTGGGANNAVNGAKTTGACDTTTLGQNQILTSTANGSAAITQSEDASNIACPDGRASVDYFNLCLDIEQNQGTGMNVATGQNKATFNQTDSLTAIANTPVGPVTQTQGSVNDGLVGTLNQYSSGVSTASATQQETQCEDAATSGLSGCSPVSDSATNLPPNLTQNQYGPEGIGKLRNHHGKRRILYKTEKGFGTSTQLGNNNDVFTLSQTSTQNNDQANGSHQQNFVEGDCSTPGSCTAGQTTNVNGAGTKDGYVSPSITGLNINCQTACQPTPPPTPTFVSGPTSPNYSSSAAFNFNDAPATSGVSFLCKIDGGTPQSCSPNVAFFQGYGSHTFQVQAVDNYGNKTGFVPATPFPWTNTPPTPMINSGPADQSTSTSPDASFTFSDTDTSLNFICSLDGSAYTACSPGAGPGSGSQDYTGLAPGSHTFSVEATDGASPTPHVSASASVTWTVRGVLIAGAGDSSSVTPTEANDNIANALIAAGYSVAESATLPSTLSNYYEVWWVDTSPPTAAEQSQLVAFEQAGGGVYLTGENDDFAGAGGTGLNPADQLMVNSIVSGGGITLGGDGCCADTPVDYSVNPTVVGSLATQPNALTTWTPTYPGLISGMADSSVFASDVVNSTTQVAAAAWDPSSTGGNGRLVVFMDINWAQAAWQAPSFPYVTENVAFFLSGLSSPPPHAAARLAAVMKSSQIGAQMKVARSKGTSRTSSGVR